MLRFLRRAALAVSAVLGCSLGSHAHDLPMSSIDVQVNSEFLLARVTAHSIDLSRAIGPSAPEDSLLDRVALPRLAKPLFALVQERIHLAADGRPLSGSLEGLIAEADARAVTIVVRYPLEAPAKTLEAEGLLFPDDPLHLTLLDVRGEGGAIREDFFNKDQLRLRVALTSGRAIMPVVKRFVASGIHHIFIGPDHILFIIGLILLGGSVRQLLKIVTGFTIAHSITLTVATLGLANPPGRIIEPLIALSIVYVGLDNLRAKPGKRDMRAFAAFGFGLVHGFGFASVLREFGLPPGSIGWALLSFNAGVEVGQVCIVAAVAPVLALVRAKSSRSGALVAKLGSVVVALAGAFWFVERVFFSS